MARVVSPIQLSGTVGDLVFYMMDGTCYVRQKTSLDKARFYRDPHYAVLPMMRVKNFGQASRLVAGFYRFLPKAVRNKKLFNQMTALAHALLWNLHDPEDVKEALEAHFELQQQVAALKEKSSKRTAVKEQTVAVQTPPATEQPVTELVTKERGPLDKPVVDEREQEQPGFAAGVLPQGDEDAGMELSEWRVSDRGVLYELPVNGQWVPFYEGKQTINRSGKFPGWNKEGWHPN